MTRKQIIIDLLRGTVIVFCIGLTIAVFVQSKRIKSLETRTKLPPPSVKNTQRVSLPSIPQKRKSIAVAWLNRKGERWINPRSQCSGTQRYIGQNGEVTLYNRCTIHEGAYSGQTCQLIMPLNAPETKKYPCYRVEKGLGKKEGGRFLYVSRP